MAATQQEVTDLLEEIIRDADMTLDEAFDAIAAKILKGLMQTEAFKKLERIAEEMS